MKIHLTEQLWDTINPEFDGHTGLVGETGDSYTPEWSPLPDIVIYPVMMFTDKDIGKKYNKAFFLSRKNVEQVFIFTIGKINYINITDKSIIAYKDNQKHIVQGENTIVLRDRK